MRKRVAGGVVLVAIGIGIWLSNLFNGLGPGGAGTDVGMNPEMAVSLDSSQTVSHTPEDTADEAAVRSPLSVRPIVIIDGQEYFLEVPDGETTQLQPTTLEKIVEIAQNTSPDEDGIRVQIKRRGSSRHSAEAALDTTLREAGVTEEQIQRHGGFID